MVNTSATRKRLRMSRAIDVHRHAGMAAVAVPVGVVGALHRGVVVGRALHAAPCSAIGSQMWPGTDWPAQ